MMFEDARLSPVAGGDVTQPGSDSEVDGEVALTGCLLGSSHCRSVYLMYSGSFGDGSVMVVMKVDGDRR